MVGDGDSMRFFVNDDAMIRQEMPREAMPRDDSMRFYAIALPGDATRCDETAYQTKSKC